MTWQEYTKLLNEAQVLLFPGVKPQPGEVARKKEPNKLKLPPGLTSEEFQSYLDALLMKGRTRLRYSREGEEFVDIQRNAATGDRALTYPIGGKDLENSVREIYNILARVSSKRSKTETERRVDKAIGRIYSTWKEDGWQAVPATDLFKPGMLWDDLAAVHVVGRRGVDVMLTSGVVIKPPRGFEQKKFRRRILRIAVGKIRANKGVRAEILRRAAEQMLRKRDAKKSEKDGASSRQMRWVGQSIAGTAGDMQNLADIVDNMIDDIRDGRLVGDHGKKSKAQRGALAKQQLKSARALVLQLQIMSRKLRWQDRNK